MKYKLADIYRQLKEEEQTTQVAQYKIYCDLDGVLCDFDARFEQFAGMSPKKYEAKYSTKKFWDLIDNKVGHTFWSKMPWMYDGKQLWDYIKKYNPTIISAPSDDASSHYGKRLWVEANLDNKDNSQKVKLILAKRPHKQEYSRKNRVLIDDNATTIEEWSNRGGIGILHTSAEQTINQLQQLGI
jgi:FMN phosphatase YigB (HAD superfamily)